MAQLANSGSRARASYSNYGAYIDIAAPGSSIYTTDRSGGYATVNGTSFASPDAAATAALVMSANAGLTPTDVLSIITNTAKDLGSAGGDPYYGFGRVDVWTCGRVNAGAAVTMAANVATSDRTAPTASATLKDMVAVDVQAQDDFGVTSMDLFVDGAFVATDTQEDPADPYRYKFAWDSTKVSDGTPTLTARAKDAAGNLGTARNVSVTVANNDDTTPPTFTSRTPASGATVSGVMTMSATATGNVAMANVTVSGGCVSCSGTTPASCSLNLKRVPVGTTIVVSFTATDAVGNHAREQAGVTAGAPTTTKILPSTRTK